jgi:hypothetical protein
MIRFVDLTPFYWHESTCGKPICAFIDTVTDRFVENDLGCHDFCSLREVEQLGERFTRLLPAGFFPSAPAPTQEQINEYERQRPRSCGKCRGPCYCL